MHATGHHIILIYSSSLYKARHKGLLLTHSQTLSHIKHTFFNLFFHNLCCQISMSTCTTHNDHNSQLWILSRHDHVTMPPFPTVFRCQSHHITITHHTIESLIIVCLPYPTLPYHRVMKAKIAQSHHSGPGTTQRCPIALYSRVVAVPIGSVNFISGHPQRL